MASMNINTVYPPIVDSSIPAFLASDNNLTINFSLPLTVNFDNVKHMAVKIVQQSNNKSIVDIEKYYDGIIYIPVENNITYDSFGNYYLNINRNDIKIFNSIGWQENMFYKIQLRFGYTDLDYTDRVSFFKWKKAQSSINGFSEWSNVIITKSISKPRVEILNNLSTLVSSSNVILNYTENVEATRFPEFQGGYYNAPEEPLDKYRFRLYKGREVLEEYNTYLSTDWLQFNGVGNNLYSALTKCVFNQPLEYLGDVFYTVIFDIITKNKYQCSSEPYTFTITETYLSSLKSLNLIVKDNCNTGFYPSLFSPPTESVFKTYQRLFNLPIDAKFIGDDNGDIIYEYKQKRYYLTKKDRLNNVKSFENDLHTDEDGCISIYIKNNPHLIEVEKFDDLTGFHNWEQVIEKQNLDGVYYLSRSSEKTNFTIWEDIARFEWFNETAFNEELKLLYEDFTVESGVKYKYAIQKQGVSGIRSTPKYELSDLDISPAHQSNFQACYIYNNGIQVRLNYDVKIQQFKHTRLFQKQDSLNSKYPIILRNGLANYAEFSFGGKITLHSDNGTFFMRKDGRGNIDEQTYQGGYRYNGDLVIPAEKYLEDYFRAFNYNLGDANLTQQADKILPYSSFNFDHSNNNIFMERIYRKYVEEFLNNGGYKLYKSPTEGNMIVTLTNVSLTPNQQLGRIVADFTSTIYEVADNTLSNLKLYNINPLDMVSNNMKLAVGTLSTAFKIVPGQVRGVFDGMKSKCISIDQDVYLNMIEENLSPQKYFTKNGNKYIAYDLPSEIMNYIVLKTGQNKIEILDNKYFDREQDDIINWIKQQEEKEISDEKKYRLNKVSQIWVELYPKYDIKQEIQNLKAITYDTKINKLRKQIQIAKYELMLKQYDISQSNVITLVINSTETYKGEEINLMPGRVYQLDNVDIKSMYLKYSRPILINYVAEIEEVDHLPKVTIEKQELANWGQISGIFTENENILNYHKIERDKNILTVSEDYNYNLYQSLDIMDIIKEKTKEKIFSLYGITEDMTFNALEKQIDDFLTEENLYLKSFEEQIQEGNILLKNYQPLTTLEKDSSTDVWTDKEKHYVIYHFDGLESIEIEGDTNTEVIFNAEDVYNPDSGEINLIGNYNKTKIGPTNKFILKKINRNINELRFTKPSYGIINFRAIVSLEIKGLWQKAVTSE